MSLQSAAQRHPILFGFGLAVFMAAFLPVGMAIQGLPVSVIFRDHGTLIKLLGFCVGWGIVAAAAAYVLRLRRR